MQETAEEKRTGADRAESADRVQSGDRAESGDRVQSGDRAESGDRVESGDRAESADRVQSATPTPAQGLERLAFGCNNDAVRLMMAEEPLTPAQIGGLDLFGVTSIKRDKAGGMEVHFADRLKALEHLIAYNASSTAAAGAQAIIGALLAEDRQANAPYTGTPGSMSGADAADAEGAQIGGDF